MEQKKCTVCAKIKDITEFYTQNKKKKDGTPYIYYHPECKECTKERAKNSNYDYELRKKRIKEWRSIPENMEAVRESNRKHKEKGLQRKWQQENKDKIREYNSKRQNKNHDITKQEWLDCKEYFNNECAYCGMHINEHFKTWYGKLKKIDFHKEHVDHEGLNDLSNCVPSCQSCNTSKWVYSLEEWYNRDNPKFTQERLDKIHKWLDEDYLKYIK